MLLQGALHYRADQGVMGGRVLKDLLSSEQRPRDSFLEVSFGVLGHLYRATQAETRWPHRSGGLLFAVFLFLPESLPHCCCPLPTSASLAGLCLGCKLSNSKELFSFQSWNLLTFKLLYQFPNKNEIMDLKVL